MENNKNSIQFLDSLLEEIEKKDRLHAKKVKGNITDLKEKFPEQLEELVGLVKEYFKDLNHSPERIVSDYLSMIKDMRMEGLYFNKHGKYRCENQAIANQYVYSKPEVMVYYMNALLVSQIMWKHHFNIFMFFQQKLKELFKGKEELSILDIGPGHGFFSFLVKKEFQDYKKIDIIDISDTSLDMTKRIIGYDGEKVKYFKQDVFDYDDNNKYDFIVLGEVIEHLDKPKDILIKLSKLLNPGGLLWVTTPTNSPALDHVYLFKSREEVFELIEDSGLMIVESCHFFAEDLDEKTALKFKITDLVGLFCKN
jgi:2-polyprenyl-3-methyl-5-hydroxy-6-metoxy-1,4-benzoquinol methylase